LALSGRVGFLDLDSFCPSGCDTIGAHHETRRTRQQSSRISQLFPRISNQNFSRVISSAIRKARRAPFKEVIRSNPQSHELVIGKGIA